MNGKGMDMKKKMGMFFLALCMVGVLGFSGAHASTLSFYTGIDVLMNSGGGPDTSQPWLSARNPVRFSPEIQRPLRR